MKVRFMVHFVPVENATAPNEEQKAAAAMLPPGFTPQFFKPGEPVIMSHVEEVPFMPVAGMMMRVAPDCGLRVTCLSWDRLNPDEPVKVVFAGHISPDNLAELTKYLKQDGWQDGCACKACSEKTDFADHMRRMMEGEGGQQ